MVENNSNNHVASSACLHPPSSRSAIVLLDPVTEWKPVLEAARNLGYVVITLQISPVSESMKPFFPTPDTLKQAGAAHVLDLQDRDVYACVQALKLLTVPKTATNQDELNNNNIVAVIPLSETAVDFSDTIAAMLGLSNHNPLDTVLPKRDKGFMKEAVHQSGLAVAKFARVWNCDDFSSSMRALSLDYPVVVKTPQGFSTTDVFISPDENQAQNAVKHVLSSVGPDGRRPPCALLEEFIGGTEFAVNLIATNQEGHGNIVVTDVWKYDKNEKARYQGATLCDLRDPAFQEICEYAKGVAVAVGIQYGAAHVELKAQSKTVDGTVLCFTNPVMMEVGARLSGGRKSTMIHAAYLETWDPFQALIQSHLGTLFMIQEDLSSPPHHVHHIFLPVDKSGRVRKVHFILSEQEATTNLTTIHSHVLLIKAGDYVEETKDITSCAGFVWLVGEKEMVDKESELILSNFWIEMEEDTDS